MQKPTNSMVIEGAWHVDSYARDGDVVPLTGILLLTSGRWSTLYFVSQPGTDQRWGSAEAGRYTFENGRLTFHHELTFQGGAEKLSVIDVASTTVESCSIELSSETLKIHFPSGNVIHCSRYSE
jgi:hypothetical protein